MTCKSIVVTAKTKGNADAIDEAFNALDVTDTGTLNRHDVELFMEAAARHTKLDAVDVDSKVVEAAVEALFHDATGGDGDEITREQFRGIFDRHPDMLTVFEGGDAASARREAVKRAMSVRPRPDGGAGGSTRDAIKERLKELVEDEEVWVHALKTKWKNRRIAALWLLLYVGANVAVFATKAVRYAEHEEAQAVFGQCITVARGCAAALNLNACLVLLAMCKHFLTVLRNKTALRYFFPFDAIHGTHIMIGIAFALFAASHTAAHICDFHRLAHADEEDIDALFGDKLDIQGLSPAGRWGYMLGTRAGITGIIMVVCLVVAYSFAFNRREHFNRFWYSHHLLLVMLIALCVHGTGNLLEPFESVYWMIGPLTLYFIPRFWRESPMSELDIVRMEVKKGDVVQLRLKKSRYFRWLDKAGMYGFLNVPKVSRTQWHPFTLTSAPSDDYIEFHFRNVGDWTGKAHDIFAERADDSEPSGIKDAPVVKVEGPIGASTQGFWKYSSIVLVGAGIGVTPMISVLKHILADPGNVRRCFFYWTVRDRDSFLWFTDLMDEVFKADKKHILQVRHFLTSVKQDDRDLGAVLLHHATRAHHRTSNVDLLLGQQIHHQVEVGRPDWLEELESVRNETESLGESRCGIFLCGPTRMADAVYKASKEVSNQSSSFHMYFSKETF